MPADTLLGMCETSLTDLHSAKYIVQEIFNVMNFDRFPENTILLVQYCPNNVSNVRREWTETGYL